MLKGWLKSLVGLDSARYQKVFHLMLRRLAVLDSDVEDAGYYPLFTGVEINFRSFSVRNLFYVKFN